MQQTKEVSNFLRIFINELQHTKTIKKGLNIHNEKADISEKDFVQDNCLVFCLDCVQQTNKPCKNIYRLEAELPVWAHH